MDPAPAPGRTGEGPWLLRVRQSELWVSTPSGDTRYALTRRGRVAASSGHGGWLAWEGVAISPDGRQVAYIEQAEPMGRGEITWGDLLWVVNADGSDRRLLVDLRKRGRPEERAFAGPLLWSSDGSRVAYVMRSFPEKPGPGRRHCPLDRIHAVEVSTGENVPLFDSPRLGFLQFHGWSVERGEVSFSLECEAPSDAPWEARRFFIQRLGNGASMATARGSVSPDGGYRLLLPSKPREELQEPPLLNEREVDAPTNFRSSLARHVVWMHEQPVAYLTTFTGYSGGSSSIPCVVPDSQPPSLYRLDAREEPPQVRRRTGLMGLMVLAFSPDDAYVLAAAFQRTPGGRFRCEWDALLVVERTRFEEAPSLDALVAASIRLDVPPIEIGERLSGYVGWLR
ncbi:hypothetical protein JQX13_31315 [Archangium violaceum]|nr:hypothetical protein JQX13_31315 [Archangium violaceum]